MFGKPKVNIDTIEVNQSYKLYGVMGDQKRMLCYVVGRQGNAITLLLVDGIATATVQQFDREYAKVQTRNGLYNLFPCNRVTDVQDVADVCEIIMSADHE